jgi:hypothetical protein
MTSPRSSTSSRPEKNESRMSRMNASLRFMKFYGACSLFALLWLCLSLATPPRKADARVRVNAGDSSSHDKSPPSAQGSGRIDASPELTKSSREESPPTPQRRVIPEKLPSHSSMFLNKLGLSGESRTEVYRALIQTRKVPLYLPHHRRSRSRCRSASSLAAAACRRARVYGCYSFEAGRASKTNSKRSRYCSTQALPLSLSLSSTRERTRY